MEESGVGERGAGEGEEGRSVSVGGLRGEAARNLGDRFRSWGCLGVHRLVSRAKAVTSIEAGHEQMLTNRQNLLSSGLCT